MKKKLVIFDCFGVIFDEIAPYIVKKYAPDSNTDALKDKIFIPADLGTISLDELFDNMASEFFADRNQIINDWNRLIKLNRELIPLIVRLKENADIALISNAPKGFVEDLFERHSLTRLFDRMIISCNIGMAKPDDGIYRYCLSQFSDDYDEIFMVDDNAKNLRTAETLGITAILFENNSSISCLFDN